MTDWALKHARCIASGARAARHAFAFAAAIAASHAAFGAPGATPTPTATPSPTVTPTPKQPVFTLDPISQRANVGQNIMFFGEVEVPPVPPGAPAPKNHSPGGIDYGWNKDGQPIDGATTNSLSLPSVTVSDDATYNCQATNAGGTATSGNARLIVNDPPKANVAFLLGVTAPSQMVVNTTVGVSVAMCNTSEITWSTAQGYQLAVVADASNFLQGAPAIPLSSDKEVVPALGGTYFFSFNVVAPATPGPKSFQVQMAENAVRFGPLVTVNISVINVPPTSTPSPSLTPTPSPSDSPSPTPTPSPAPPVISREPADLFANAGQSVKFFSGAFEPPAPPAPKAPITYQWNKNGSPISGETDSALALTDIDSTDGADYNCQATNGGGTASSRAAKLTVHTPAKPNLAEFISASAPPQMFLGQSLYIGVLMRNSSEVSWTKPQGYALAAVSDPDALLQGATRFPINDEADVIPPLGGLHSFVALVTAPASPGTYTAQFRMIEEFAGVPLFGPTVSVTIEAIARPNGAADWAIYE